MIHIPELNIPYRKHTKHERDYFVADFGKRYQIKDRAGILVKSPTIYDIERFWSQTFEAGQEVATKLTKAGFLLSVCIPITANYHGSSYNIGLVGFIFPSETSSEILAFPTSTHYNNRSNLGELVYWQNGGFDEEPITVQYDLDIDSPQRFEEVARLEQFLKQENLPFQVTPTMEDIEMLIEKHRRETLRAELYKKEHNKTFQINK